MTLPDCPPEAELAAFHCGAAPAADIDRITAHLEECVRCEMALQAMDATGEAIAAAIRAVPNSKVEPPAPPISPDGPVGTTVAGRYKVIEAIGEGGMGAVYMAQQAEPIRRLVALKVIKPGMDSRQVLARFEAERQALALMDHPNIAKVLDAGTTAEGRPYFAMELVKGVPITRYCDEHRLTPRERLELFIPVCNAIQHAHQKGIIHRDLKPSNVLVARYDSRPVPKVIDFGVAKATGQPLTDRTLVTGFGEVIGTPEYMAPEQAELNQLDVDTRVDVFALGVLLYELLTGTTPLDRARLGRSALLEVLRLVREEEPPRPSTRLSKADTLPAIAANRLTEPRRLKAMVRGELDWIVMRAIEKDRSRRYETASGLARDVERYLADEPVEARPTSAAYRLRKVLRRHKGATVAALLCLATVVVGAGVSLWLAFRAAAAEARTQAALNDLAIQHEVAKDELATRKAVQQFFLDKVFAAGRPEGQNGGLGPTVSLRQAVDASLPAVVDSFRGRPLVEAEIRRVLGETYIDLGEPKRAIEQLEQTRRLRTASLGAEHLDTIRSMNDLAEAYSAAWKKPESIQMHSEVLALLTAKVGPDAPETMQSMTNLAVAYERAGQVAEAIRLHEEALARKRSRLKPDDPSMLASMLGLASAYASTGRRPEAIVLLEEVVRIRRSTGGDDHPETLTSLNNLSVTYAAAGRRDEAIAILERIVPIMRKKLGPAHSATFQTMYSLGNTYAAVGRMADAVRMRERARDAFTEKYGAGSVDTLARAYELATMYERADRLTDAIRVREEMQPLLRTNRGPTHADTASNMFQLARLYLATNRPADAQPLLDEFLACQRTRFGDGDVRYAEKLVLVGGALLDRQRFAEAEVRLRDGLAIYEAKDPDTWGTANARSLLGGVLAGRAKMDEAEPLLLAGYEGLRSKFDQLPPEAKARLTDAADRLVQFYEMAGRPNDVAKWKAERAKYPPSAK
jgi:tetratricopeptide (TPR) repeat protein